MDDPSGDRGDVGGRRRRGVRFAVIAGAGALVLALTIAFQLSGSSSRSWRLVWAIVSISVTASLFALLVAELVRQFRAGRVLSRADDILGPIGWSPDEEDESWSLAQRLDILAARLGTAFGATWTVLRLDDPATAGVTWGAAPPDAGDGGPPAGQRPLRLVADLTYQGSRIGSVEIGRPADQAFRSAERMLIGVVAERVAGSVERAQMADAQRRTRREAEQARRQVNVLARASVPLAPALESPEEAIVEMGRIVVPDFADLFTVDLLRSDGGLDRTVMVSSEADMPKRFRQKCQRFPSWTEALRRVMAAGVSELSYTNADEELDTTPDDDHRALMETLRLQSWVVAPIRVQGVSLGTMTLATQVGRRGYRSSDHVTIDELAARSSIAFERSLLYQEARRAARDASARAEQLARLAEATIVFTYSLVPSAVIEALVEQAPYVLGAPYARAHIGGDGATQAEHGERPTSPICLSSPLLGDAGQPVGLLTVERPADEPFAVDDEAVIAMLAGSASAATRNARLFQDVRNREQRLHALIEGSPLAILEIDTTGTVRVANPAATALFPAAPASPAGVVQPPAELVGHLTDLVARAVRGERGEIELATTDVSGDRRDLWVSTAPVRERDGSVRMLAFITDMTGRKRLEEQLATAQRFEAIATLAGGVAHDFNNLLTVILGYSEILLQGLAEASAEREQVEAIQEAGGHAAVITNQLLTLSRHQVLQPETIDAGARCQALLPMLRRLAGEAITIDAAQPCGANRIRVDPGQLEQVLFNLVINSRDAMPHGGHLDIELGQRVEGNGDRMVLVRVTDDGAGMDRETLARCQEPFFTTKGRSRGIGLGLATVASILERSGGTIEIESAPGRGTSSTVVFPNVGEADGPPAPTITRRVAQVLLVDDDVQVRRFTERVLTRGGYAVTGVGDGESAIRLVEGNTGFDLVVTDVALPAMSGVDVLRTVRRRWPMVACLLITGHADEHAPDIDTRDTVLVAKPFTPEDLLRAAELALATPPSGSGPVGAQGSKR